MKRSKRSTLSSGARQSIMPLLKDPIVGRYALQKELSRKGGRQTFVAQDLNTHTPVIVKILQFGGTFNWDTLKLFKREAKILQQLNHPAISKYKDSFEAEINGVHGFVLVQDYIAAPSLQTLVEQGKQFSQADVIEIARQLLETLKYLHQQLPPVIHRDIKPSNILLSLRPNGTPKQVTLVDFGSVQVSATKHSGTMTIVGSYGYMPLEQFSGQTTPASDLYSLGMTLMYLLTGTHPAEMPQEQGRPIPVEDFLTHGSFGHQPLSDSLSDSLSDYFCHWLGQLTHPYVDERMDSAAIALTLLRAKDGSHGYYPHLMPPFTSLHLHRKRHELTVITKLRNQKNYTGCLLFPMVMGIAVLWSTIAGPLALLLGPSVVIAFLLWEGRSGYPAISHYTVLSIHRQRGIRMGVAKGISPSQLSRVKWQHRPSPFSAINLVTYTPSHTFKQYVVGNTRRLSTTPGMINLPPQLSIHAGKREYSVQHKLSAAEQHWVDQELNDFLGLSLRVLNPADESQQNRLRQPRSTRQTKKHP